MRRRTISLTGVICCVLLVQRSHPGKSQTAEAQTSSATTAAGGEMLGMGGGNVYVAKSVNGLANFRMVVKKNTSTGADTPIGTQQNGHYLISNAAEIPAFEAATGLHAETPEKMAAAILKKPATGQTPAPAAAPAPQNSSAPSDGTVSDLANGTIRVTFTSGKYTGDTVDFTADGGDAILKTNGEQKGEAKYGGGNGSPGKAAHNLAKGLGSGGVHR